VKNKRGNKAFSKIKGVYSRKWYMGKRRKFGKFGRWVWWKNRSRSYITRGNEKNIESKIKPEYGGVQEEWVTREVYGKDFIWME